MTQLNKPCAECPFSRKSKPGDLGGSDVGVYVGQANGPFRIPCHCTIDYSKPDWKTRANTEAAECAGAAIFRANLFGQQPHPSLLNLPADKMAVFSSFTEFVCHHTGLSEEEVDFKLMLATPDMYTQREMRKVGVQILNPPTKPTNEKTGL